MESDAQPSDGISLLSGPSFSHVTCWDTGASSLRGQDGDKTAVLIVVVVVVATAVIVVKVVVVVATDRKSVV